MLYFYGLKLGFKLLLKLKIKPALHYLIVPVNYWRYLEYKLVCKSADFNYNDKILDIGSPKLLSIYLSKVIGADVYATDIEDYFIEELSYIKKIENIQNERLHLQVEDGRDLHFENDTFSKEYSISVLEHIPNDGDIQCARELGRVLDHKGRCYITVPFSMFRKVQYKDDNFYWAKSSKKEPDGRLFYQRFYSEADLYDRIITPSNLKLISILYVGERFLKKSKKEIWDYIPNISGPIQPILSLLFHTKPNNFWKNLKKPLCAFLVLEKP